MSSIYSPDEVEIFKGWLLKKKNEEIANEIKSELDVSKTLKMILEKMTTLENSLNVLSQMGLIPPKEEFQLTEKGEKSFEESRQKFIEESKNELKTNSNELRELDVRSALRSVLEKYHGEAETIKDPYVRGSLMENKEKSADDATRMAWFYTAKALDPVKPLIDVSILSRFKTITESKDYSSELEYNTELLNIISKRMVDSIIVSDTKNLESSVLVPKINGIIHNLYQIIVWLDSQGQLQQSKTH